MTTLPNAPDVLISCLNTEVSLVSQFITVLEQEAQILETGQPDDLVECTAKKQTASEQITQASAARDAALGDLGFEPGAAGLRAASDNFPDVSVITDRLLDLAFTAQRLNEANGVTIGLLLRQNQQLLEALQRLASTGQAASEVYDASGKSKTVDAPPTQPRMKPVKAG